MYRFSVPKDAVIGTGSKQLVEAGITRDDDYRESLEGTGELREDEDYYRVENVDADTPEEAVAYVQGVIRTIPSRVWINGEEFDTDDLDLASIPKPGP